MPVIDIANLTKDYGHGRGVFDLSLGVEQGECFGFLGPNSAGKTTTIRHVMGFSKPQQGTVRVLGEDSWAHAAELQRDIGYLPGEVTLPTNMTGTTFLRMMERMRGMGGAGRREELAELFELDAAHSIKQMSLGEKRKLAIVAAFMHDPDVLVLDEPTSGLDPVMQQTFVEWVLAEKARGKTVLFSSHIFREVDAACDRIAIIKEGRIVSEFTTGELQNRSEHTYVVTFANTASYDSFAARDYRFATKSPAAARVRLQLDDAEVNRLIADLAHLDVADFVEVPFTLEDYFMQFYEDERVFEEVR